MRRNQGGLERIIIQPEPREYLLAQFLGEHPPTVPPVLSNALRRRGSGLEEKDRGGG